MAQAASVPVGIQLNPATAGDPNYILKMMQAQRQQKLADALMGPATSDIEYDHKGKISPYQGLSKMLAAALSGYEGNKAMQSQAQLNAQGNQAYISSLSGNSANPVDINSAALAQSAQQGQSGPTNYAAGLADRLTASAPHAPNIPGGVIPTPNNPLGLPPPLMWGVHNGDPAADKEMAVLAHNLEQTNEQKNSQDARIGKLFTENMRTQNMTELQKYQYAAGLLDDGDPRKTQIEAQIKKLNNIAPILAKPGEYLVNPTNGDWSQQLPTENGNYNLNVSGTPVNLTVPGQAQNNANAAGMLERAKQGNTFVKDVQGANGTPNSGFVNSLTGGNGIIQGQGTADAEINKDAGKVIASYPERATEAKKTITTLEQAERLLTQGGISTGPGTNKAYSIAAVLKNLGLPVSGDKIGDYQQLSKYLQNALSSAAAVNGNTTTNDKFDQFASGNPTTELNPEALLPALHYVQSQLDSVPAASQYINKRYEELSSHGIKNAAQAARDEWAKFYDPNVFHFNRMTPQEKSSYWNSLSKEQQQHFEDKATQYQSLGFVQ